MVVIYAGRNKVIGEPSPAFCTTPEYRLLWLTAQDVDQRIICCRL